MHDLFQKTHLTEGSQDSCVHDVFQKTQLTEGFQEFYVHDLFKKKNSSLRDLVYAFSQTDQQKTTGTLNHPQREYTENKPFLVWTYTQWAVDG